MNYAETLIAVADDCPVTSSLVPAERGGKKTAAVLQYEMIMAQPHGLTQEDVLFQTWLLRQDLDGEQPAADIAKLRDAFFAKEQACLRSSPLPKKYGFGLHFDSDGRVALLPMESEEYARLAAGADGLTVLKALRSKRA